MLYKVPMIPQKAPNNIYKVPMSLWLVEKTQRLKNNLEKVQEK